MRRHTKDQQQEIEELKAAIATHRTHDPKAHLTPDLRHRVLRLVDQSMPAASVARAVGISKTSIYAWQHATVKSSSSEASACSEASIAHPPALPTPSDVTKPRVFAVTHDVHTESLQYETQLFREQTKQPPLRLQIGGFDITIAWQKEAP